MRWAIRQGPSLARTSLDKWAAREVSKQGEQVLIVILREMSAWGNLALALQGLYWVSGLQGEQVPIVALREMSASGPSLARTLLG